MKLEWEPKIGPAAVVGFIGTLSVLVGLGVTWGSMTAHVDVAVAAGVEAKNAAAAVAATSATRDIRINKQAEEISSIQTSLSFIVPTLQRIESKLDTSAKTR